VYQADKYKICYYPVPRPEMKWAAKDHIEKAPLWCSVDLRDGNQSLIIPMNLQEKLEFFDLLVRMGFKEIEVGFPAASETEYRFLRTLIDEGRIPRDVTVQVLTQARENIMQKTIDAIEGVHKVIIHLYNSTSRAQREQVFKASKGEIAEIAVNGARYLKEHTRHLQSDIRFQYSPESFTGTETPFALDVCNAVLDVWQPTPDRKAIINLPVTVAHSMPHVYANQIEYMSDNLKYRENVVLSLHPHNDRGTAVADTELALLAGADRVEGTLFGNGERTGNVDLVTVALNMYTHGIDPGLDFSDMPQICRIYEKVTKMKVHARQPYGGALVFAAFSGSHQDAIAKGMRWRKEKKLRHWTVPYLPIDPEDLNRVYETDVIRINSQSGKGGIGYVLEETYGLAIPDAWKEAFGYYVKNISDREQRELTPPEIFAAYRDFTKIQEQKGENHAHDNDTKNPGGKSGFARSQAGAAHQCEARSGAGK